MSASTDSSTHETIEWLAPGMIEELFRLDTIDPSKRHDDVRVTVLIPIAVLGLMSDDFVLTEHGHAVVAELQAEDAKFSAMKEIISGETLQWLLNPETRLMSNSDEQRERYLTLHVVQRIELVVNDIVDAATGLGTKFGQRFCWYLHRQAA